MPKIKDIIGQGGKVPIIPGLSDAEQQKRQKGLDDITLLTSLVLLIFLTALYFVSNLSLTGNLIMTSIMFSLSAYDALNGYINRTYNEKFYWQLFIARITTYGFLGLVTVLVFFS